MAFSFDWVDAFSSRPFGGNGCAVLHDAAHLDDETCMNVVRETSLVECTFTGPSDVADIRVRYFLASREIPFAGHPTVATVAAMRRRGLIEDGPLTLETLAGIVPVTVKGDAVSMVQIAPEFGRDVPAEIVAPAIGLAPADILHPPQIVSTGLPFCITVLSSRDALTRAALNTDALADYFNEIEAPSTDAMEPFLVTLEGATEDGDTCARLLLAPPSPAEDPFTGSATGAMAAYLWARGLIDAPRFVAEQGHGMGRPGRADVEVLGPRDAIEGVRVSGRGYVLMSGEFHL
ncbi:PhzF family phenazine biosynthesis protein [Aliishimia ponticola]|uniref:PhzF family phenazine biosynthesis protein n=1 Tax=Aliishimia ponticola TaxID=2499833 RepID=A0A4V3XKH5_9RHOB|nr:PhzF family phenazine biosynthesis protein [Aliishimia ponticola]THH37003.1 PhzF family phenazine biosynthesis protein [Aliishimia ponticola]